MLFTFNKGDIIGSGSEASSIINVNLDCIVFIQEVLDPGADFPSRWFVSLGNSGWFVTKDAFNRLKRAMESK